MAEEVDQDGVPTDKSQLDLSEPTHIKKRNESILRNAVQRSATFHAILQHRHGRDFIRWMLSICKVNTSGFSTNALIMAQISGERNIGLQLMAELTTRENIDLYFQMIKEGAEEDGK